MESFKNCFRANREQRLQFLKRKRENSDLSDQYIFRRFLTGELKGEYEQISNIYKALCAFNWDDEKVVKQKLHPIINLSANSFWFYVNSMYFPSDIKEIISQKDQLESMFDKIINRIALSKPILKKNFEKLMRENFISDIYNCTLGFENEEAIDKDFDQTEHDKNYFNVKQDVNSKDMNQLDWKKLKMGNNEHINNTNTIKVSMEINDQIENQQNPLLFDNLGITLKNDERKLKMNLFNESNPNFLNYNNIDYLINQINNHLNKVCKKNSSLFSKFVQSLSEEIEGQKENKKNKNNLHINTPTSRKSKNRSTSLSQKHRQCENLVFPLLKDLETSYEETEDYRTYLKKRHEDRKNFFKNRRIIRSFKEEMAYYNLIPLEANQDSISGADIKNKNTFNCNNPEFKDDITCLICNDGDYEENDMMIYCSECQLTVHQSCYGIGATPTDDWICEVCKTTAENYSESLECVFCSVKGGAMKQCQIKDSFGQFIFSLRKIIPGTNKVHSYIFENKMCKLNSTQNSGVNTQYSNNNQKPFAVTLFDDSSSLSSCNYNLNNTNGSVPGTINSSQIEKGEVVHHDYLVSNSMNNNMNIPQINSINDKEIDSDASRITAKSILSPFKITKPSQICYWIHLSCALWHPEVIINDFKKKEQIEVIETITKSRFSEYCSICNLSNYGPTLKCETEVCNTRFHVECARINHYCLEIVNKNGVLNYYIFCNNHRRNKNLKRIESRKERASDDIKNFANVLNKIYSCYEKEKGISLVKFDKVKMRIIDDDLPKRDDDFKRIKNMQSREHLIEKKINIPNQNLRIKRKSFKKLSNKERTIFINQFKHVCKLYSCHNVIVLKKLVQEGNNFALENSNLPSQNKVNRDNNITYQLDYKSFKNKLRYNEVKTKVNFPWELIKFRKYSRDELKSIFDKIIIDEIDYNRKILKRKHIHKINNTAEVNSNHKLLNLITNEEGEKEMEEYVEDTNTYCYCKKRFRKGDFMISCKNEINCCGSIDGWFHKDCVEELKYLSNKQIKSKKFVFVCKECSLKN